MMFLASQNAIAVLGVSAGLVGWVDASVRQAAMYEGLRNPQPYSSEVVQSTGGFSQGIAPDEGGTDLKSAKLRLWPADVRCDEDVPSHEISLAPETCLSGSYSIDNNIRITEHPVCADGSTPLMVFYGRPRCSGNSLELFQPNYNGEDFPEGCFWSTSPQDWSIIFRCGIWPTLQDGADEHVTAIPPNVVEMESDGIIETHDRRSCGGNKDGTDTATTRLQVDKCLSKGAGSVRIIKPAYCANGTRAILAHFEGDTCDHDLDPSATELAKMQDQEVGTCLEVNPATGSMILKGSMMFWCGKPAVEETPKPKPRAASVSDSACLPRKAPLFQHPKTDTCLNLGSRLLKIYSAGVCADGTQAVLAKYDKSDCVGKPDEVKVVAKHMLSTCLDVWGWKSISFLCTGEVVGSTELHTKGPFTTTPGEGKGLGTGVGFVVGLSLLGLVVLAAAGFVAFAFRDQLLGLLQREGRIAL